MKKIVIVGIPVDCGKSQQGCMMGPDALRCAQIEESLVDLGHDVCDSGNIAPTPHVSKKAKQPHQNDWQQKIKACSDWIVKIHDTAFETSQKGQIPIFLGGDHLMSAGTVSGLSQRAQKEGREQFVLWLDAHPDFHTLSTTKSGNLHGTPVAYFIGRDGFQNQFPPVSSPVKPENICMLGIRSVDTAEHSALGEHTVDLHDMNIINESGITKPLRAFLDRVKSANGHLHVSFDVDFLDPSIAPAVGTAVPDGVTFKEAHRVMEILHEHDLVTSVDIAELNPLLDERGRTAHLMVDLIASLMGKGLPPTKQL